MSSSTEITDAEAENEEKKSPSPTPKDFSRKKLLKEAMRDIFVSVLLVILTTFFTQGDFQKSPTSSILASGIIKFCTLMIFFNFCPLSSFTYYIILATSIDPILPPTGTVRFPSQMTFGGGFFEIT